MGKLVKTQLEFIAWFDGIAKHMEVSGKAAKTLAALVSNGRHGVTAYEISQTWALRLAAYIHDLRKLGLDIQTIREEHDEGWHGRYILHTPVEIIDIE
tara:strand:- start:3403 stop:3696 length:294 start_codon:yes stop_codon:yes gene_type:complete